MKLNTRSQIVHMILLLAVLALAAALRFYRIEAQSLWSDEGNSVALAGRTFAEIAQRTAFDIHPPFYYWLLKMWTSLFGTGEAALRSLSAVLGVGVVALVWWLGARLYHRWAGFWAALVAVLSPLLVYYSQEARMYMLLTFVACLTVLAALFILDSKSPGPKFWAVIFRPAAVLYMLAVTAGLYTHYAYPVVPAAVNAAALLWFVRTSQFNLKNPKFDGWLALQIIPLLLYLPWLPTAWRQLTTWPGNEFPPSLPEILRTVAQSLLLGLSWPGEQAGLVLPVLILIVAVPGLFHLLDISRCPPRWRQAVPLLYLWFLLPVLLTVVIFSPAFLKFLVVAVPPLALLLAVTLLEISAAVRRRWLGIVLAGLLLAEVAGTSLISLNAYYHNPAFARDNYRGIVAFIRAVSNPEDAVILNAEGQQDVFGYYWGGGTDRAPVFPLPRRRPLNEDETVAELEQIAAGARRVYAVYWAAEQADPARVIEDWLDDHLFKATDRWFGNVRLVSYAAPPAGVQLRPLDVQLGENIRLTGAWPEHPQVTPGDILPVALRWQAAATPEENYTVFLQVLDGANHLVGQVDAPPQTSSLRWPPGEPVADAHGIFIEPGTPPGSYRLVGGLYNSADGRRLATADGADFVELGTVEVFLPEPPLPETAFQIQHPLRQAAGGLTLLGYDLYKLGHRSAPDTPLLPGDPVRVSLYWQRGETAPDADSVELAVLAADGSATPVRVSGPAAGVDYPPAAWRPGQIVRAQFDLFLSGLEAGEYRLQISAGGSPVAEAPFLIVNGE